MTRAPGCPFDFSLFKMKVLEPIITYENEDFDFKSHVDLVPELKDSETSTAFCDLSEIVNRLRIWKKVAPKITPVAVLRRNDDPKVVKILDQFQCRFMCCSRGELDELLRNYSVPSDRILWSNSVISRDDAKFTRLAKINSIQVGRSSALKELKAAHPEAK